MADDAIEVMTEPPITFKKRQIRKNAARRRRSSSSNGENGSDSDGQIVVRPAKKTAKPNPNFHTSISVNKKSKNASHASGTDSDDDTVGIRYKSEGAVSSLEKQRENATATYQMDTELDKDAQAIFEKAQAVNKELEGKADDKIYRGLNNYAQYYKKRDTAAGNASSGLVRKGPIRAPANLRATVRWDYQPDICKDYKETGFCGFGDSCKFLHDRGDYKHGWQLERDTEQNTSKSHRHSDSDDDGKNYEIDSDDENLPFKCFICREDFTDPIVTKCKHYFCEKCALEHYKKSQRCFICNQQTTGVFNPAKELMAKIRQRGATIGGDKSSEEDSD